MERKPLLSLIRYVAALCIAMYHFEWLYIQKPVLFGLFYIWVEFFFLLSGFFVGLYQTNYQQDLRHTISFWVKKQVKKQYPLYVLAALVNFIVQMYATGTKSIGRLLYELYQQRWEYLGLAPLIPEAKVYNIVGPAQQIPITIMGGVICMLLGKLFSRSKCVVFPLCSIGMLGVIVLEFGNLSQWTSRIGPCPTGIVRGIAEMLFGYWLSTEVFPRINQSNNIIKKKGLSGLWGMASIAILIGLRNCLSHRWLICYVAIWGFWIVAMYCTEIKRIWLVNMMFFEKISYPIFLFHGAILSLLSLKWPNYGYVMIAPYMILLHVVAIMMHSLNNKTSLRRL